MAEWPDGPRGMVLTVADLSLRFGGSTSGGLVVVVEVGERKLGLRVERVDGVQRAALADA